MAGDGLEACAQKVPFIDWISPFSGLVTEVFQGCFRGMT
jgi:hypothetical protein